MLKAHLDAVEQQLLHTSKIPANAGHMLHRGTPREAFIKQFLIGHLSAKAAVGTGEIIDSNSLPRQLRNQFDIIIYKADYPKIDLGGGINAFLAESVIATIEVKSLLTQSDLQTAIRSANKAKKLQRNLVTSVTSGYMPPGILSYVVAYDGPAQISTVYGWLKSTETTQGLNQANLPISDLERLKTLSESLEGILVLGKGSIIFDNAPLSIANSQARAANPSAKYQVLPGPDGNLMWLFLLLTQAVSNLNAEWGNLVPYLQRYPVTMQFWP